MEAFLETIMEKHAGWLGNTWGKIPWVQKYRQVAASPGFKAKKAVGTVAMASVPVAYGAYQLGKQPDPVGQMPQNMPQGYN